MNDSPYSLCNIENIKRCKVDSEFLGEVMLANENLIWHSIHKYCGKPEIIASINGIEKDDIFQLGRVGFIKAIYAFDTERGIKFSSFAVTYIVGEVRCYLRDNSGVIKLTRNAYTLLNKIRKLELEHIYSIKEISILFKESEDKIIRIMQMGKPMRNLDEYAKPDKGFQSYKLIDVIPNGEESLEDKVIDRVYITSLVKSIAHRLTTTELNVLMCQINGKSQAQTAKENDISQMKVTRILKKIAFLLRYKKEFLPNTLRRKLL